LAAQETDSGRADELRAQVEKLQNALREIELKEGQRGKVTEIGSSHSRQRESDSPRLVVKVYDLSDLFTVAPSYRAYEPTELLRGNELVPVFPQLVDLGESMSGGGFGGGGLFSVPSNLDERPATIRPPQSTVLHQGSGASGAPATSVRTSMGSLIETITSTIDPDGWADTGGPSTISPVGSSLLISTTSETHAKLTALIDLFRQRWGSLRTINLDAHWLWLSPQQVADAMGQPAAGPNALGDGASQLLTTSVSPEAWKKLLAVAADEKVSPRGFHAMVTCYNGQTVTAQAGSQRLAVIGLNAVTTSGEHAKVAFAPVLRNIHEGATLQITPLATRHVKYVVLDVHSRVNLLPAASRPEPEPGAKVQADGKPLADDPRVLVAALDRGALQTQRLETTLRVPVGQPTLIGGMTFVGQEGKSANLYLFINAKVQELRDDDLPTAAAQPAVPPAAAAPSDDKK
jgi:hypothetical protein